MHVAHLSLRDFRSYAEAEVPMGPGATAFVGPNGQGKTNLVEAVDYVSTLASHRVATDSPLVRVGADTAVLRARVVRQQRQALVEIELVPGGANKARVNRVVLPRAREVLGLLRTVVFSPEDLALVKGDPHDRRRFLDQLLIARTPRMAAVRADYDRVLKQRNTLLKTAAGARRSATTRPSNVTALHTLDVWDDHLARTGAELLAERLRLITLLEPLVGARYRDVAGSAPAHRTAVSMAYAPSFPLPNGVPDGVRDDLLDDLRDERAADARPDPEPTDREALRMALLSELATRRDDELDRGVTLVGPHRDELRLGVGEMPAKGYASQGESWSLALSMRLAAYDLLRADGDDPVLVLDDVFAELDTDRRDRLAASVSTAEQVLVTAAVAADVPDRLDGARFTVLGGSVTRVR